VTNEVIGSHIRSLIADKPFDVASSSTHTVKPWFNSHTVGSPRVVDLEAEGFPLLGGRIDVIAKTPVPSLVYGYQKHRISVTEAPGLGTPPSMREAGGYHVIGWTDGGISYWAVSDVGLGELQKFVQLFRAAPTSQ
jgi:anti-sigma factor RsiW